MGFRLSPVNHPSFLLHPAQGLQQGKNENRNNTRKSTGGIKTNHPRQTPGNSRSTPPDHQQESGSGSFCLGCTLLHSICHRGNPGSAGICRTAGRRDRAGVVHLHCPGHRFPAGGGDHLLRADHPCLPGRRWCVYRCPRQPGGTARPDSRRCPADRLHPDGGSQHLLRRGAAYLRFPGALSLPGD